MPKTLKIIILGALILAAIVVIFNLKNKQTPKDMPAPQAEASETQAPKIVGTKPDPLEEGIVAAGDTLEITFNRPLENAGEFKSRIDPEIKYKVELSGDRRTAKIVPDKPFDLGTTYTLFIGTETKFDGVGRWGEEKVFHFRTISYRGV